SVVSAESARSRDRNKDPVAIRRVQNNRMQAHAACAWLPLRSGSVTAHSRKFVPGLTTVGRAKQRSVFDTGIDGVGLVGSRLEMPDLFELPRLRSAVIKLVRRELFSGFFGSIVNKLIALAFRHAVWRGCRLAGGRSRLKPRLAAVVRALNDLSKPATGL